MKGNSLAGLWWLRSTTLTQTHASHFLLTLDPEANGAVRGEGVFTYALRTLRGSAYLGAHHLLGWLKSMAYPDFSLEPWQRLANQGRMMRVAERPPLWPSEPRRGRFGWPLGATATA